MDIIHLDLPGITWDNYFNEVLEVLVAFNRKDFRFAVFLSACLPHLQIMEKEVCSHDKGNC